VRIKTVSGLGMLVKDQRKKLGWSQIQLAQRAGVSRLWIGNLEKGKPSLEIDLVFRSLRALGISLNASLVQTDVFQGIL
jgi:HTH-type transcriptional regulator/antitoxin HipB